MMKLNVWQIKVILAEKGMTQNDLAIKVGISRQGINDILNRESCTLKTLGRIAKALGVPVQEIVKEE